MTPEARDNSGGTRDDPGRAGAPPALPDDPPISVHPPTIAGAIVRPAREAVWPTAIGVIAIAYAALGVLFGLYGAATPWLMSWVEGMTPRGPFDVFAAMRKWEWWLVGLNGACVLAAIVLLAAGIALLRRRAWASVAIVLWAVVKIGLEVGLAIVQAAMQREQMRAIAESSKSGVPVSIGDTVTTVMVVVLIVMVCAMPVFMLIWFFLPGVRGTIAKWRAGVRA